MSEAFRRFADHTARIIGSAWVFVLSVLATLVWLVSGPFMGWSTEWNFIANTSTTVVTWLLVVLLQNTQNRDTRAIILKLDELIRATKDADDRVIVAEELSDAELLAEVERIKRETN